MSVVEKLLLEIIGSLPGAEKRYPGWSARLLERAQRYAVILERSISPEGTLPVTGRSLAYRAGALQVLAQLAQRDQLPAGLAPAQVRGALTAVIHRTLSAAGTFDAAGWLRTGLAGAQPSLGETYITTASLYLCTAAFLPLGLPPEHPFWSDPPRAWTARRAYAGEDLPADKALKQQPSLLFRP